MRPINRIEPIGPVQAFKTYQVATPRDTFLKAACEQVDCPAWRNGWETTVDESTPLGMAQARYIRGESRRTFTERRTGDGRTVFRFESGQRCFAEHKTRPELYSVRDGDYRGNPTGRVRKHVRPADWVEDFHEHQQTVRDQRDRG